MTNNVWSSITIFSSLPRNNIKQQYKVLVEFGRIESSLNLAELSRRWIWQNWIVIEFGRIESSLNLAESNLRTRTQFNVARLWNPDVARILELVMRLSHVKAQNRLLYARAILHRQAHCRWAVYCLVPWVLPSMGAWVPIFTVSTDIIKQCCRCNP